MQTTNVSNLKIHKLTKEQYERELAAGNIDEYALYLTPDEEIDLSGYATKEEVNTKADTSHTHDDRYYTEDEIDTKLAAKADSTHAHSEYVNQNAFSKVVVGSTTIEADTTTDTLTLTAGSNIALTPDASGDKVTIAATDTVYTHPSSGVTAGTYKSVTVNDQGHVTAGTNPTTLAGYGITDAESKGAADTALAAAKTYADSVGATVKNDLLNGAGAAYDTLKELGDLIDSNTDAIDALNTVAAGKADTDHSHSEYETTADASSKLAEAKSYTDAKLAPITTSGTSTAYTATVSGITELTAGVSFMMIPHVESASTSPTLDVNGLGAIRIRRRLSTNTTTTSAGYSDDWLSANKPIRVTYDGTFWIADLQKPSASDLMGAVPVQNGGTGVSSEEDFKTLITSTAYQIGGDEPTSGPILWFDTATA